MSKYKYSISYIDNNKTEHINFRSKRYMLSYLDKNKSKLNKLNKPVLNFGAIALPIKSSVWK